MRALFIHRFCIRRCCDLPRRSACLALRTSSVETLRHMTWGSRCGLQHPLRIFWRRCCGLPRRFPCLVLRASSVKTLHHRTCGIRKRSRRLQCCLQTPLLTIFCYDSTSFKDQIQSRNDFSTPYPCFFHPLILVSSNLYYS